MIPPGLGGPRQMKTGTGRILGRVLASDSGTPIRRAQVRLTAPEIGVKTALTDADGRFEFRELPGGRFSLNASKSGYVNVQYGQTRPFEQGRPIELADKQVLDKADISMPRGGVITGRLTDEFGDPVPDAMVSAMRQTWSNGRRRLLPTGRTTQTNDLGQYRMYGLPPGEYYISATLRNTDIMMLDAAMLGGGSGASGSTPSSGYAPTYFPGTTAAASAQRVTVAIAQEAQNTDFALAPVRLARISGTVMTSEGKPLEGAMVSATPSGRADVGMAIMNAGNARTTKDGNFTLNSVAPGDYVLTVRSVRIMTSDGGDMMTFRATIGGGDGGDGEAANLPLAVSGEDLANVVIVTSKGATASGRLLFEGSSTPPAMTAVRITAAPAEMDGPLLGGGGAGQAKEDGSFQLRGLSGRRLLRAAQPAAWLDAQSGAAERRRRHRQRRRVQAGSGRQRARDRRDLEADRDQRHGHGLERLANQGLHGRGLFGRLAALEPPAQPLGDGHAAGSGRPFPRAQPAAGQLQRHRAWTTSRPDRGAIRSSSNGSRDAPGASRSPTAEPRSSI